MTLEIATSRRHAHHRAHGADAVRAKLSKLESTTSHVLHAVSLGAGEPELDYLVISPAGVFPVSVRDIPGGDVRIANYGMSVDGKALPFLRQAKFDAERVARLLEGQLGLQVPVRGCVVLLSDARSLHIEYANHPIGVSVLAKHDFARWFRGQPSVLTQDQVRSTYEAALRLAEAA